MRKTKWYLLALAAVALCAAGWTGYAQKQGAQRTAWEYRTVHLSADEMTLLPSFRSPGEEGWELATAVRVEGGGVYFTFKRPK